MKKIISAIVAFATICTMATSVFAFSRTETVSGEGASLSGTTITCGDEGFVFSMSLDANATTLKANAVVKTLLEDGWTISDVAGMEGASLSGIAVKGLDDATNPGLVQVGYTTVSAGIGTTGKTVMSFKAVPSETSKFENLQMIVWTVAKDVDGNKLQQTQTKNSTTYTVVKAAPVVVDKVTTEDTLTDGEGVVEFDYAADYVGNKAFEGKKVIFQNVETTRGNIKADTKVKVTRISTNEVKYFGEKLYANWGVEGEGELAAKTIAFGLVIDAELNAADFEFVIE